MCDRGVSTSPRGSHRSLRCLETSPDYRLWFPPLALRSAGSRNDGQVVSCLSDTRENWSKLAQLPAGPAPATASTRAASPTGRSLPPSPLSFCFSAP